MFDFFHKWLGIPPEEQPPDHYRLLGLRVFEDDADVIDAAADKHLAFLHNLANGEHGEDAEYLSNKISAARVLLLNRKRKAQYDEGLLAEITRSQTKGAAENAARVTVGSPSQAMPPHGTASDLPRAQTPPALPSDFPRTQTSARQLNTSQSCIVEDESRNVLPGLNAAPNTVAGYGGRKLRRTRSKVGIKQRRRRVSWIDRFIRLSTVVASAGIIYVTYGLLTGELELNRDAFLRLFPEARVLQSDSEASKSSKTDERPRSGGVGRAELQRTQPSGTDALRGDHKSSSDEMTEGLTQNETSADSSHEQAIPSDEIVEKQMSEILRILQGKELFDQLENDHPEEVAYYFYNQAVKQANAGNNTEGLAYFTLAYQRLLKLKRYQACLSVLDSIPQHYAAYPSRERKLGVIREHLKIDLELDRSLFLACCELIEECVRNGDFADANRLWDSLNLSNFVEDTPSEELVALRRSITEFQEAFDNKESGENLAPSPDASESIGIFYCFYADDWDKGLEHLSDSRGEYSEPADLERKSASPLKIAEAWEKVWKEEDLPIRKQAIGRRMLTNYNQHRLQDPGKLQLTLGKKLDRFVKQVFPRDVNQFVWGRNAFPRVMDTTAKAIDGKKPDVSKGNQFERSRRLYFEVTTEDAGEQFAAIELDNVSEIKVDVKQLVQLQGQEMTRALIVDYHTPGGYFSRVFMRFDQNQSSFENVVSSMPWSEIPIGAARANRIPAKSCGARPVDDSIRLYERDLRIDLENWAPPDWDGRVWFMVYLKDARPGYVLSCTAEW